MSEKKLAYGLAGPSYTLFPGTKEYVDNRFVAELAGIYGMDAVRMWVPHMAEAVPNGKGGYEVSLQEPQLSILKDQVQRLKEQGVKKIVACPTSHVLMKDYSNYVWTDGKAYSMLQVEELHLTGGFRDYYTVPNPVTEPEAYEQFKDVQKQFFKALSEAVPDINYIEPINEPEGGGSVHPAGVACGIAGWEKPEKYDDVTIAKICMDYCYAATLGVKEAGNHAKVLCVALTGTYGGQDFLRECYRYIAKQKDSNPDHYFEILNWHPYIFYTLGTGGPISTTEDWDGWYEEWVAFQNDYHQIAVDAGDGEKTVWFTEFGVTDCGVFNTKEAQWPTKGPITGEMAASRLMKMLELTRERMSYVSLAFIFRITDLGDRYFPERTMSQNFAYNYEANFGLLESFDDCKSGQEALKDVGKALYRLLHDGSADYTPLYEMLNRRYKEYRGVTEEIDEEEQFQSVVSGILLCDPDIMERGDE